MASQLPVMELIGTIGDSRWLSRKKDESEFKVGEQVYVKPGGAQCTARWQRGVVSRVNFKTSINMDGIPRNIADLRHLSPERRLTEIGDASEQEDELVTVDGEMLYDDTWEV